MKSKYDIENEMYIFKTLLESAQRQYKALPLIDLLSGEGRQLAEIIDRMEAKIEVLKWILQ